MAKLQIVEHRVDYGEHPMKPKREHRMSLSFELIFAELLDTADVAEDLRVRRDAIAKEVFNVLVAVVFPGIIVSDELRAVGFEPSVTMLGTTGFAGEVKTPSYLLKDERLEVHLEVSGVLHIRTVQEVDAPSALYATRTLLSESVLVSFMHNLQVEYLGRVEYKFRVRQVPSSDDPTKVGLLVESIPVVIPPKGLVQ